MRKLFLLIATLILISSAFLSTQFTLPPTLYSIISTVFIISFALPSFYFLVNTLGIKKGLLTLLALLLFAIAFEFFAIKTGFPYGHFSYSNSIGFLLFNTVPLFVGFAWAPITIGTLFIAQKMTTSRTIAFLLALIFTVAVDFVLDPGAVASGYWQYSGQAFLYGVPLTNFLGWIISGAIGLLILEISSKSKLVKASPLITLSLFGILIYWTTICYIHELWISFIIGIFLFFVFLFYSEHKSNNDKDRKRHNNEV